MDVNENYYRGRGPKQTVFMRQIIAADCGRVDPCHVKQLLLTTLLRMPEQAPNYIVGAFIFRYGT